MAMAGSAAASLTSQIKNEALTCALCLDIYRQPKLLPCSHTFCLKCLKDLVDQASSKDDSRDGAQPLKTHMKAVAAVEAEVAEPYSEKDSGVLPDVGDQNEEAAAEGVGSFALFASDQAEKDCDRPKAANDFNLNVGQATASTEDQNQTDKVTEINDNIEEKIYVQFPTSADDPENEKKVDSTIGAFPTGDDLAETRAELTDSGIKGEDNLTASTTSGYAYPYCEDEFAPEVFYTEGVSQLDPQESEAVNSGENVPENAENIQKPTTKFFHCPSCREQIKVPEGGASAFQNNVYLREDDLERAREEVLGLTHSCKTYDLFCVECDVLICVNCKLSEHLHHKSQTLAEAAANAKTTISQNKARLKSAREGLEKNAEERATDREQFADKKNLVEKEINQRHSKMVTAADKYRDEALKTLKNTFTTMTKTDSKVLDDVNKNITEIRGLEERVHNAETSNDQCELVLVAKELRCGSGSRQVVDKLASLPRLSEISRPVIRSPAERDDVDKMFTTMEMFIGTTEYVKMKTAEPEAKANLIHCQAVAPNAECFCICPASSGKILRLTFIPSFEKQAPLSVSPDSKYGKYTRNFQSCATWENNKISYVSRRDATSKFIHQANHKDSVHLLYAKYHTKQIFKLQKSDGTFSIDTTTVVSDNPLKTKIQTVFDIPFHGNIRAFDMNDQEQLAAVIFEDRQTKARQVKLFRRPRYGGVVQAVATYTPPMATSVLADVCFFTLQGQEVLLIADEANDAIHVVEVKDDKMTFTRFLCPGCPLLLQPTALNTDHQGRLWVGCRGGRMVTFQPLSH